MTKLSPIALGLVTWNGERFLRELMECITTQSFSAFKLYVLDNQSTDKTLSILGYYAAIDERVEVHIDTCRRGFIEAQREIFYRFLKKHEYCAYICDDDVYENDFLAFHYSVLNNSNIGLSYSKHAYITETGSVSIDDRCRAKYNGCSFINPAKFLFYRNCIPVFFGVYRVKDLVSHMSNFRRVDKFGYNHENLMLFSLMHNSKISYDATVRFYYRIKDRKKEYEERGYLKAKGVISQLIWDIRHNIDFSLVCMSIAKTKNSSSSTYPAYIFLILFLSFFRYTFYVFVKVAILAFIKRKAK
ncbi:MAG: glycosyltransferase [bacterium]